jgi:hypothetical protein
MIGVGLTGAGLIGGGAFAFGAKSSYDAADNVKEDIVKQALDVDLKTSGERGICSNPENWLQNQTASPKKELYAVPANRATRAGQYEDNCAKYTDNVKSGDTFKTLSIASFAVAGAAAVGTIIYYFADSGQTEKTGRNGTRKLRVVVLPIYQPGFSGGLVSGSF